LFRSKLVLMKRLAVILGPTLSLITLLRWHEHRTRSRTTRLRRFDALLALQGSGRHIWADEHADEYVKRLREGWE
jgi:hypothetical protein